MSGQLFDPFGRSTLPMEHAVDPEVEREARVWMIEEVRVALITGRLPPREAALYFGESLTRWLKSGGSLEHELRVVKPKSHRNAAKIWREIERHQDEDSAAGNADHQLMQAFQSFMFEPTDEAGAELAAALEASPGEHDAGGMRDLVATLAPALRARRKQP